ncbi:MAG TPA: hypothetical protein VEX35_14145 [Allosphingosinicella sp.]|nr:hypothetical protein [Allosphingosinicella sp.]
MIRVAAAALLLFVSPEGESGSEQPRQRQQGGSVTFHQQIIIRVSPGANRAMAQQRPINWQEERGPRCIPARQIAHAALMRQQSFDLILRDRTRLRARLERRCPALDYYVGFYISPTRDGLICAERDSIRSRAGGECRIDRFRTLRPEAPDARPPRPGVRRSGG